MRISRIAPTQVVRQLGSAVTADCRLEDVDQRMPFFEVDRSWRSIAERFQTRIVNPGKGDQFMRKYGKWALTLGLMAATPSLGFTAPWSRKTDADQAAETAPASSSKPSNQQMADRIATSLRDARMQGFDIGIEYKNGVATLTGRVTDPAQKDKATQVVSRLQGVEKVDNKLVLVAKPESDPVRGPVTQAAMAAPQGADRRVQQINFQEAPVNNNQAVAEQIAAALTAAQLDGYDIEIRYQDGAAVLGGSVGTMAEREAAERVVSQVPGVMSVQNHLSPAREPMPPRGPAMHPGMQQQAMAQGMQHPGMGPQGPIHPAAYQGMMGPGVPAGYGPGGYGPGGPGASPAVYNSPSLPDHAWPSYAQYPNSAAISYPQQYSASAFPYIGPFYPYPQVPLGWRDASLRWDDGQWNLQFRQRTDKWWWFMNPKNW